MANRCSLLLRYPKVRKFLITARLYLVNPHLWSPALKTIIRTPKARRLGIKIIKPRDTYVYLDVFDSSSNVIDVGCGQEAELSMYLINKYGLKSYGIDPTEKHQYALQKLEKLSNNRFQHVHVAVASTEGKMTFYETLDHESGSLFKDHKNIISDRIRTYAVNALTIQGLLRHLKLPKADLIKLDLEGAEYELLRTINYNDLMPFRQIYIEFHHHAIGRYSKEDTILLVKQIRRVGFDVFSLDDHNYLFYKL